MFGLFRKRGRTIDEIAAALDHGGFGSASNAGPSVNEATARRNATVLACSNQIASDCSTPPVHVYEVTEQGRRRATDHPAYRLIARRPNEFQTSQEFRDMLTRHAALCGAGLAIKTKYDGVVRELIPVMPGQWSMEMRSDGLAFRATDCWGRTGRYEIDDVFYLPNRAWSLDRVEAAIQMAREAIGLSISLEDVHADLMKNGLRSGGFVTGDIADEALDRLKAGLSEMSKPRNRFRFGVLPAGAQFKETAMTGVDAQHLETREHQVVEICRVFGVHPALAYAQMKTMTFASAEAFIALHYRTSVLRWHALWKARIDYHLLDADGPLEADFDVSDMTRAPLKERADAYAKRVLVHSRNELRAEEGRPPIDDPAFDVPLTPVNMTTNPGGAPAGTTLTLPAMPMEDPEDDDTAEG